MPITAHRSLSTLDWLVEHDPLPVSTWHDPLGVEPCFDARSIYVETYWLPVLGPSSILAARRLASWLEAEPGGFDLSPVALAESLGLAPRTGRNAPVVRTLARLADFGLAHLSDTYGLRSTFPRLHARQIARLPDHLAAAHTLEYPSTNGNGSDPDASGKHVRVEAR